MHQLNNRINKITESRYGVLLLLAIVGLLTYLPSMKLGLTSDFYLLIERYDRLGLSGWFNSFDDWSLKYVYHGVTFLLYKVFGLNPFLWWLVFVSFHICNAWFVVKIIDQLFSNYKWIAIAAGLLFLTSPFQHEVVIWRATIHYQMATLSILVNCYLFLRLLETYNNRTIWIILLIFFVSIFALETVLVLPGLFVLIYAYHFLSDKKSMFNIQTLMLNILLPLSAVIVLFFVLTKLMLDQFIGHYGDLHTNFDPSLIGRAIYQYLLKFVGYFRYWTGEVHVDVLQFADSDSVAVTILLVAALVSITLFLFKRSRLIGLLLILFFIALLPVLNLETPFNRTIQADRYGYLASAFYYGLVAVLAFKLFKKYAGIPIIGILVLHVFLLQNTIGHWKDAETIKQQIIADFPKEDHVDYFILNAPDHIHGAYIFRQGLWQALQMHRSVDPMRVNIVSWTNRLSLSDTVQIQVDSNRVRYQYPYGQWIHSFGGGLRERNQDYVHINKAKNNLSYTIEFIDPPNPFKIIYLDSLSWKSIEWKP